MINSTPPFSLSAYRLTPSLTTRILRYIQPQFVHVFVDGRIVTSGGPELADELEENGYVRFTQTAAAEA
ncbi:hypothetical protein A5698_10740 [Mycobacterium sp. E136]|nr:hypothetical protein A5698_10740 [Mycobacterium sp. E136]